MTESKTKPTVQYLTKVKHTATGSVRRSRLSKFVVETLADPARDRRLPIVLFNT